MNFIFGHKFIVKDNTVNTNQSIIRMGLKGSDESTLCCNTFIGTPGNLSTSGLGLLVSGTNPMTKIKSTTFDNGGLRLIQSNITPQDNFGNRWKGQIQNGILTHTEILSAADNNSFLFNPSESNSADGNVIPSAITPNNILNLWFRIDDQGDSKTCLEDPLCAEGNGGGGMGGTPPDYDPNNDPCFPGSVDLDGDKVCDEFDINPEDPCLPYGTDTDGDGICDVVSLSLLLSAYLSHVLQCGKVLPYKILPSYHSTIASLQML